MSHHCHESHTHSHEEGCCNCHSCKCECHSHKGKFADELLELADEAWMDVLKEKIMEEIRQHSGEHLTEIAKVVAEANHLRWKERLQGKKEMQDFEDRLHALFFCKKC